MCPYLQILATPLGFSPRRCNGIYHQAEILKQQTTGSLSHANFGVLGRRGVGGHTDIFSAICRPAR